MQLLGKLSYIIKIRPDISYSVNHMATRVMICTDEDFDALLRIVSYLSNKKIIGSQIQNSEAITLSF